MKIFLSSTFVDLQEHRRRVIEAIDRLRHTGADVDWRGMEAFGAQDDAPTDGCIRFVDECDLYVGFFGVRYGSIDPASGRSLTEVEYRRAVSTNKRRLIFLLSDEAEVKLKYLEQSPEGQAKLKQLKDDLKKDRVVDFFTTDEDLALKVSTAIMGVLLATPSKVVAWQGELSAPETMRGIKSARSQPPVITIGKPEVWRVADALASQVGQKWVPPLGGADFWLARFACTLRAPGGGETISEAQQGLYLRPKNSGANPGAAYAFSLFPERLGVEDKGEFSAVLGPELTFADGSGFKVGELGAKFEFAKMFPVIQSYGVGESNPSWVFKSHASRPLAGSQLVYAVLAAKAGAQGIRGTVVMTVTVETQFGPVRFGMSREAQEHTQFVIE